MIIKEAKNLDNLAVLYEGWTPGCEHVKVAVWAA